MPDMSSVTYDLLLLLDHPSTRIKIMIAGLLLLLRNILPPINIIGIALYATRVGQKGP